MLTVLTPAASHRLTTIPAAREHLRVGDAVTDIEMGNLIDQASAAARRFCNRTFALETVLEVFRDGGRDVLSLSRWPVVTIQSISAPDALASDQFEADLENGILYRLDGCRWCGRVAVTYQGGYVLPEAAERTLPADVEQACLTMVAAQYSGRGRDPMLRSESTEGVGAASWIATAEMGSLPPQATALLLPFRRGVSA